MRYKDGDFYTTEKISPHREKTPEGFLLIRDVPISRVGEFDYSPAETGIPALNGRVSLSRSHRELFNPDTIASFEGKPIVVGHKNFADPKNWKRVAIGTVQNVRQGAGEFADCLLADLLLTDEEGIRLVESGELSEVSCGYDAKAVQDSRGRGHQEGIVGNHVALVHSARCGGRCKLGDGSMIHSWKSKLRRIFRDGDEEAFNEELDKVDVEEKDDEPAAEEMTDAAPAEGDGDKFAALEARLAELERIVGDLAPKSEEPEPMEDEAPEEDEALEEEPEPEPDPEDDEAEAPEDVVRRVLADAQIVCPGMKRPHGDSARNGYTYGLLRRVARTALKGAGVTAFGDASSLDGKALEIALMAAADKVRDRRNPHISFGDGEADRPLTVQEINANFWKDK